MHRQHSDRDNTVGNLSGQFEELKFYQFYLVHLPSTHGKKAVSSEDTLHRIQVMA